MDRKARYVNGETGVEMGIRLMCEWIYRPSRLGTLLQRQQAARSPRLLRSFRSMVLSTNHRILSTV